MKLSPLMAGLLFSFAVFSGVIAAGGCNPGQAVTAGIDVAKAIVCVDTDLNKGMTPAATAVDCGLQAAADVENLVGASERLAAHRAARGLPLDGGTDAK